MLVLIEKGDADAARDKMHNHIERSMQDMLINLEEKKHDELTPIDDWGSAANN